MNPDDFVKSRNSDKKNPDKQELFEFTSNEGRGVALSRRIKVAIATFNEVI